MVYDLTMLEAFYSAYKGKVEHVRAVLKRPLTLAEKILYAHLFNEEKLQTGKTTKITVPTASLCRTRLPRWHCFNS